MNNCMPLFYLCLALCGVLLAMLAMFFNYSLKLKEKSIELSKRTTVLEKKNGKELAEIERLKEEIGKLEKKLGGKYD
ncbi:hypothetical protein [endosymbiont GvMRE of Glomus versiforme]|uniref:hypothetical protein n=1 Tax=endosymbiont GvMRE of Glomus versiforme TaxID=2039283 RepID=UPI000ECD04AE|nr:hypothetical protein [endosymbiont GvMRE of Glomus versiforme]RHZ37480.1 hypothetical protein GvMRE_I1g700 [endosymbiont GvMRE of Glomus versiforme]